MVVVRLSLAVNSNHFSNQLFTVRSKHNTLGHNSTEFSSKPLHGLVFNTSLLEVHFLADTTVA